MSQDREDCVRVDGKWYYAVDIEQLIAKTKEQAEAIKSRDVLLQRYCELTKQAFADSPS